VAGLKGACERGLLRSVKGFGEATEAKILDAVRRHETNAELILLSHALPIAAAFRDFLGSLSGCVAAEVTGSVRRRCELVSNVDLVAAFDDPDGAAAAVARHPLAVRVDEGAPGFVALRLADGVALRVTLVTPEGFGEALWRTTGSASHVASLAAKHRKGAGGDERSIYASMGLPWIPPELRENAGEIEAALEGDTFEDLVELGDIRGLVHCHTTWSDGRNSVEEMGRAAERLGVEYLTVTDHSPTASYAGGVTLEQLRRQWAEIDDVAGRLRVKLLKGTESDILPDGSLDYALPLLRRFDVVIASIHNRHGMNEDDMTARVVAAMRQPVFKIWGHALGRLLKRRPPFACRVPEVLDAIAGSRAAIEINGDPHRLDLEPRWIREARKRSIRFVISTDAHSVKELSNLEYGVAMARRGGVRRSEVLNARDVIAFSAAVRPSA
jgi:DNA polymerase (family 10)